MIEAVREDLILFCRTFDVPLFDWQREAIRNVLMRSRGRWVNPIVGISVPRGDGKTHWPELWCLAARLWPSGHADHQRRT